MWAQARLRPCESVPDPDAPAHLRRRIASPGEFPMVMPMPQRRRTQPEIPDIVALANALDRDERRPPAELVARERRTASQLPSGTEDRMALALAWLDATEAEDPALRALHQRAESALHLTGFLVGLAAVVIGWSATLAAFYFDGSDRVNAVLVLALLVGLPGVMLVPFLVAAVPAHIAEKLPGAPALAALARAFSAGRIAPWLWRFFPHDLRESLALVSGRMGRHQRLYASLQKWALLRWSQGFAVMFQTAALAACVILVVFTDLAFGWSTTLTSGDPAVDARRLHRITSVAAAPWSWAVPGARPSLELIEESRYFRAAAVAVSRAEAARLGGWWRFLVLAIAVYGLLPRILTFAFARARLRAAARAAVISSPGLSAVFRRIHRAQIETRAAADEPAGAVELPAVRDERAGFAPGAKVSAVINWADIPVGPAILAGAFPEAEVFAAGGAGGVQQDLALAEKIGGDAGGKGGDALVLVKAWEPPVMEFIDFVQSLRTAMGGQPRAIVVLPVGLEHPEELGPGSDAQVKLWRDRLAAIGDPWLRVAAGRAEVQP